MHHLGHCLIDYKFLNSMTCSNYKWHLLSMNAPITLPLLILEIISLKLTLSIGSILHQSMKNDLYAVSCNTTQYGLRSIHYSGVRLWNSLPIEIKDSNTLFNFKRKLKHHYLGC